MVGNGGNSLGGLRADGVEAIEIWCMGRNGQCLRRATISIEEALRRWGGGASLAFLARRARCGSCRHRGAHVQPVDPPIPEIDRRSWRERRKVWLRAQLDALDRERGPLG